MARRDITIWCFAALTSFLAWSLASSVFARAASWTVTISTSVVDHCLEYPNSKLQPLIKASIFFEQALLAPSKEDEELARRGGVPDVGVPLTLYENLYSSQFRMVGLHRFKVMKIKPGSSGRISIKTSNSSLRQEETSAAANATLRMILDLYTNRMALRSVLVPRDVFDLYVQELQRFGFRPVNVVPGETISAILPLTVRSDPAGRTVNLAYGI